MSGQAINLRVLQWAIEQRHLSGSEKNVLRVLAYHSDEKGYAWPSVSRIEFISGLNRETVHRCVQSLIAKDKIHQTKDRRGETGRVKVFRFPIYAWQIRRKISVLEEQPIAGQSLDNGRIIGGILPREQGTRNTEEHSSKEENTPKGVHVIPNGTTSSLSFSRNGRGEKGLELYTNEERAMIDLYHRFCDIMEREHGVHWSRVNRYTDTVRNALAIRGDPEEFREFLQSALKEECSIPDRHTLVRLCWENY